MIPVPIPEALLAAVRVTEPAAERLTIGEPGDPTRDDVRPAEYLITPSTLYPGRATYSALVLLSPEDRQAIIDGAEHVLLTLDGAEVPWSIAVVTP